MWHYFEERIRSKFSLLMAFEKQTILFCKFKIKEICIDHNTCTYGLNFFFASRYKNVLKRSKLMLKRTVTDRIHIN